MNRTPEMWNDAIVGTQYPPILKQAIEDIDEQAATIDRQLRLIATLGEREDKMRAERDVYREAAEKMVAFLAANCAEKSMLWYAGQELKAALKGTTP